MNGAKNRHNRKPRAFIGIRSILRRSALQCLFLGALASGMFGEGCSSSDDTHDEAVSAVASAFCGALRDCCSAAEYPYNDGACMAPMRGRAAAWLGLTDATDKTIFDENAVLQCADAFKALESKCATEQMLLELDPSPENWSFYSSQYGETLGAACLAAVRGTLRVGESCTSSSDCEDRGPFSFGGCEPDGTCSQFDFAAAVGTACGKYGKLIGDERVVCGSGDYCAFEPDSAIGACTPAKALGESCKSDDENPECGRDAYCDPNLPSQCAPLAQAGQPCTPSPSGIGLEILRCVRGFYCDAAAGAICVATKDNGTPCTGDNTECKSARCEAGKCATLDPEFVVSAQTCSLGPHLAK